MTKICIELLNGKKMNVELYEDIAPITVKSFLKLVDEKYFDGLIFHRVIKDFMCQGGGYYIKDRSLCEKDKAEAIVGEFTSNGYKNTLKHDFGVISMARTNNPNSATSQFFLCVDNCYHLDDNYAGFGKMTDDESLKVLRELNNLPTAYLSPAFADFPNVPLELFTIKSIYRI